MKIIYKNRYINDNFKFENEMKKNQKSKMNLSLIYFSRYNYIKI